MNEEKQRRIEFTGGGPEELADEIAAEMRAGAQGQGSGASSVSDDAVTAPAARSPAEGEPGGLLRSEETVGEILLAAREKAGQTLEFMSQETKIPKQMLQYLETDNFEALPARVYVKSFLRSYAQALGLDPQHILGKYELQTGQTHRTKGDHWEIETEAVEEKIRSPILLRRFLLPGIIAVVAIVLIVKLAGRRQERVEPPPEVDLRQELLESRRVKPPPPVRESDAAETAAAVEPMELRITASPTDSCWIELETVSIVDRQPEIASFSFNLQPGRSRTFQATEEFRFRRIGNAGGVVLELNGVKLATLGKKGKVIANYAVTRENLPRDARR